MTSNQGGHRADVRFCFHTYLKNIFWKFQPSILPQSDLTTAFQNRDFRKKSIYRYLYACHSRSQWPRTRAATGRTSGFVFIRILIIYFEDFSRLSCPDQISQQLFIRDISVKNEFIGLYVPTIRGRNDLVSGRPLEFVFIHILTTHSENFSRPSCPNQILQQLFKSHFSQKIFAHKGFPSKTHI